MNDTFGALLKEWRGIRRLSQLDLALTADVSPRHISFLETGRSQPSRDMVLHLGEVLQMPHAICNQMLETAGFAHVFAQKQEDSPDVAPLYEAMGWILARHDPYPAFALDRHWVLLEINPAAERLMGGVGLRVGDSMLEALFHNQILRQALDNLAEVESLMLQRLRTELAHLGRDPILEAAVERLQAEQKNGSVSSTLNAAAMIPARYRVGDHVLSFFSTLTQFGGTGDIALAEIKIEMLFPSDPQTKAFLTA